MSRLIDLTGQKFGRLTVIERAKNAKYSSVRWLCQCDCGQQTVVTAGNLKNNHTRSCGCLRRDINSKIHYIHGYSHSKNKRNEIYTIWKDIVKRCNNSNCNNYENYGGRGIRICNKWLKFINFLEDMGERPRGMSVDRINNDGDYCPENCKWSTRKEQNRNSRHNVLITINNKTRCLSEWCEFYQLPYQKVYGRLYRGWIPEEALELIPRKKK